MKRCVYCDTPFMRHGERFWCPNNDCPGNVGNPRPLPRRGDVDLAESTDAPVFLVQRRRLVVTEPGAYESDDEVPYVRDGVEVSDEDIVAMGHGHWEWDTQRVAFTREEGDRYATERAHDGPFRVWSVPSLGSLRTILRSLTDYESVPSTGATDGPAD